MLDDMIVDCLKEVGFITLSFQQALLQVGRDGNLGLSRADEMSEQNHTVPRELVQV
jgi:hypothetical protein